VVLRWIGSQTGVDALQSLAEGGSPCWSFLASACWRAEPTPQRRQGGAAGGMTPLAGTSAHFSIPNHGKLWKALLAAHLGDWQAAELRLRRQAAFA
jgi:hypothetical protein